MESIMESYYIITFTSTQEATVLHTEVWPESRLPEFSGYIQCITQADRMEFEAFMYGWGMDDSINHLMQQAQ